MKIFFTTPLLTALLLASCGTLPKGDYVLKKEIMNDKNYSSSASKTDPLNFTLGRTIYVEAYTGKQFLENNDILMPTKILINIGREKVKLNQLIGNDEKTNNEVLK